MAGHESVRVSMATNSPRRSEPVIKAGRHSQIFRPPTTPLPSIASASSSRETITTNTRKRARPTSRPSSRGSSSIAPIIASSSWSALSVESPLLRSDDASPPLSVNTRYDLRGGLDTPTQELEARFDLASDYKDVNFRRRWSFSGAQQEDSTTYPKPGIQLGGERNGAARTQPPSNEAMHTPPSWGQMVFGIVGGVAGRMLDFCRMRPVKGFHAGGGEGYNITPSTQRSDPLQDSHLWEDMETLQPRMNRRRDESPMPGTWPEDSYFPNMPESSESPQRRPSKKSRTDSGASWIMVNNAGDAASSPVTSPAPTPATSTRRQSAIGSQVPRRTRSSMRTALQPVPRRSMIGTPLQCSPVVASRPRRASLATPRTPSALATSTSPKPQKVESPVSVEAQRFVEKQRREERMNDASIRRLNDRLSAMIKEGKEALGTKVEIVDDVAEDEGFFQ